MKRVSRIIFGNKLRVGQRVIGTYGGETYEGVVYSVVPSERATIKRDDNKQGAGDDIDEYGNGWLVSYDHYTKKWKSNDTEGEDLIIKQTI